MRFVMCIALLACGGGDEPWRQTSRTPGRTEVFVVPTLHRRHERSEDFPLELLGALLRQARPDVVLVEVPPVRFDPVRAAVSGGTDDDWLLQLPELRVAFSVAEELGAEVVPVSGWTRAVNEARRAYFAAHPRGPDSEHYERALHQWTDVSEAEEDDPEWILGPRFNRLAAWVDRALSTYAGDELGPADPMRLGAEHMKLVRQAIAARPGHRFVVLFDARRRWLIEQALRADGVHVGDPRALLLPLLD